MTWLIFEEADKLIKVSNNIVKMRVVFLHNYRCIVSHFLSNNLRDFDIVSTTMLIFSKPT